MTGIISTGGKKEERFPVKSIREWGRSGNPLYDSLKRRKASTSALLPFGSFTRSPPGLSELSNTFDRKPYFFLPPVDMIPVIKAMRKEGKDERRGGAWMVYSPAFVVVVSMSDYPLWPAQEHSAMS